VIVDVDPWRGSIQNESATRGAQMIKIDYVELPSTDMAATERFLVSAFGWGMVDYGRQYRGFTGAGLDGGIDAAGEPHGPLVLMKTDDLAATEAAVVAAGGVIVVPQFDFPGGRRFHFREPGGNVMGVWAEPVT